MARQRLVAGGAWPDRVSEGGRFDLAFCQKLGFRDWESEGKVMMQRIYYLKLQWAKPSVITDSQALGNTKT